MSTRMPVFDLFAPDAFDHPGGEIEGAAVAIGPEGYAVLSFEAATAVLRDTRFRNSALQLMEDFGIADGPVHDFRARSIIMREGAAQLRLRTPLARFMGPAIVQDTRFVLREIVR